MTPDHFLSLALWLAGAGHFCVLAAAFQVPQRMNWKQELARLSDQNRKLMWTYGGFTVLTIIAFGTLTLALHQEMLRGDRAAVALAAFIGVYWTVRLAVDFLYFGHSAWPRGALFVAAHTMLVALFIALAATYLGLVLRHAASEGRP